MARRARITAKSEEIKLTHFDPQETESSDHLPGLDFKRPVTRADCADVPRPCPFIGCRYNLYLDETEAGNVYLNFPNTPVLEMKHSCVLDLSEKGPWSLRDTSQILGLTPERIRQIEIGVLEKLRSTDLVKHKQEGARVQRQYTMTHLLLNPKCKLLMLKSINGKLDIEHLHKHLLDIVPGTISLIRLKAFITAKMKQREGVAPDVIRCPVEVGDC